MLAEKLALKCFTAEISHLSVPRKGEKKKKKAFITAREQQTHGDIAVARMLLKFNEKWQLEKCCCFREKRRGIGLEGEK